MRVTVFIDYWNLQLTLNQRLSRLKRVDYRARINWQGIGPILSQEAATVIAGPGVPHTYEGTYIYTSYNPRTDDGRKFKKWATTWLDRQPGINVQVRERKPKALPRCNTCHREIPFCPHLNCGQPIVQTIEKGVDTLLATDLIRLAVSDSYDVAVLATLDSDMLPAVQFVQSIGKKIIQAGFPPMGVELATECWGSFDVSDIASRIER